MKNTKLITALNVVVKSLKNGTIEYDWQKTNKCNCGLVAQAIIGAGPDTLFQSFIQPLANEMRKKDDKFKDAAPTWQQMVGEYCPMTGMPTAQIFKSLFEAGLTRDDLGHLEALSDPKILAKAKISTASITGEVTIPEQLKTVKRKGFLGIGRKVEVKTVNTTRTTKKNYYEGKGNFIKYLQAWIQLLEESDVPADPANSPAIAEVKAEEKPIRTSLIGIPTLKLKEAMSKALLDQRYEDAAVLRDEINRREKVTA